MKKFLLSICCLLGAATLAGAQELGTVFTTDFTAGQGEFTIENKNLPEDLEAIWTVAGNYGMKATAYSGGENYASESWLVSPVIDLTKCTTVDFSFNQMTNFFSSASVAQESEATVWAREENGTWEQLMTDGYPSKMSWSFVDSKANIYKFIGKKMQFAFVYKSTDSKAGTWEIKNVTIKGDGVDPDPVDPDPVDEYITLLFGADYNQQSVQNYTSTWKAKVNNLTWTIENFNNNKNGWDYVKCGRNGAESTGYITTDFSINEAVTEIQLTIDAITADKVKTIALYVASDPANFDNGQFYTVEPQKGTVSFKISNPAAKQFYRLEFDCLAGTKNGLVTVNKVVYVGGKTGTMTETPVEKAESLADFIKKTPEKDDVAVMDCPLTVAYANGAYVYVKDATASSLIYKYDLGYQKGDVIPGGWEGKNGIYNGLYEIVPTGEMPAATETTEVTYPNVKEVDLSMVNQVVTLNDVTFEAETGAAKANFTGKLADGTELSFRNTFGIEAVAAGTYNVTLAVSVYNSNLQLLPIEYVKTSAIGEIAADNAAAAEYFNLQGVGVDADNLTPGIYVRRQGNKVTKVIVK